MKPKVDFGCLFLPVAAAARRMQMSPQGILYKLKIGELDAIRFAYHRMFVLNPMLDTFVLGMYLSDYDTLLDMADLKKIFGGESLTWKEFRTLGGYVGPYDEGLLIAKATFVEKVEQMLFEDWDPEREQKLQWTLF